MGISVLWWRKRMKEFSPDLGEATHPRWRGLHTASIWARRAFSCRAGISRPASRSRPAWWLYWTRGCTWWRSSRLLGPGSKSASRHGTPTPTEKKKKEEQESVQLCSHIRVLNIFYSALTFTSTQTWHLKNLISKNLPLELETGS